MSGWGSMEGLRALVEVHGRRRTMIPPTEQYATDANLRARQRLWQHLEPPFDLLAWVVGLTGAARGSRVLDVGCGNGAYLGPLRSLGATVTGCDLSAGMLSSAPGPRLVQADAQHLPFVGGVFDVVLAAHMLYHVADQTLAVSEMRRVLGAGGVCVVVTNGQRHIESLRRLVESVVTPTQPGWKMFDWATRSFSLESAPAVLGQVFDRVELVRPPVTSRVVITDPAVIADYVASVADAYRDEVGDDWSAVVERTRDAARAVISREGCMTTTGLTGAFVCR